MANLLLIMVLLGTMTGYAPPTQVKLCPDAPLPRLEVGMRGEVASGVDRLRLRHLPAVGTGEVGLLYSGNAFTVIDGPSCNGGYSWWRVELDSGVAGWLAEGTWTTYYVRPVIEEEARTLCNSAEAPWLHLLVSFGCRLLSG